jgi:hypothetical protein
MIDTSKYEGHTEGPWSIRSPVSQVTKKYRDSNEGKIGFPMSDWPSSGVAGVGPCSIRRYMDDRKSEETGHANIHLVADAPLLLAEVKRLQKLEAAIEQKLNEKGDEGEAISEANPNGHYKEDELRGWCEALEFVLSLMKTQEEEE